MEILEGLNDEQRQAVTHRDGPMLVVAGAGTGKTQVITRRIAYLLASGAAKPEQILALTFTERAAREMQERLYGLIGWESFQVPVMTFHAFGAELLVRYAAHIGRPIRGGLINDSQKSLLLLQHIDRIQLEYYNPGQALLEFIEDVVNYIGQLQNASVTPSHYQAYVLGLEQHTPDMHERDRAEQRDIAKLYALYETVKVETGTYDYHDQMMLPLEILQQQPNLIDRLRREYRYVLVDEYQDTNAVQDGLLRLLVGPGGNIFAVGDDDQAIYGFRGADIGNILSFADYFQLAKPIVLVQNYRSGQPVLDASYRLIQHNNPDRLEAKLGLNKRLMAQHAAATASFQPYGQLSAELQGVAAEIEQDIAAGTKPAAIAVLSATHAPLQTMAKLLRSRGVLYSLSTAVNIFEQPELLTLWYLLTWINRSADDAAIGHVLLGKYVGWTQTQYAELAGSAKEQGLGLEDALERSETGQASQLRACLEQWRTWANEEPTSRLLFRLVFETPVVERWRHEALRSRRMVRVFEDLQRWLEQIQDFESLSTDGTLGRYLSLYPKPPQLEVQEPAGDPDGVALLTVHAAKGLEFDTVYVINATQRAWTRSSRPGRKIPDLLAPAVQPAPDHEFRRLFYVALTRAKRKIVVSAATKTTGGSNQMVSPYVAEAFRDLDFLPEPHLETSDALEKTMLKLQRYYPMHDVVENMKLPYEAPDGWLDLSVTALAAYDFCPFDFFLEHGLRLLQPVGPQLTFGTVLHGVFEQYYRRQLHHEAPLDVNEWLAQLDERWSDRGYETAALAQQDHELARETLRRWLRREETAGRQVRSVELPIRFELPEYKLRLRGKIDAVFEADNGVEIRDYKTGRSKTDAEHLNAAAKTNFQLRTYALAYDRLGMGAISEVVLDYVVTGVLGRASYSAAILRNHEAKLGALADKLRQRQFAPQDNGIHDCAASKYYGTGERDELAFDTPPEPPHHA